MYNTSSDFIAGQPVHIPYRLPGNLKYQHKVSNLICFLFTLHLNVSQLSDNNYFPLSCFTILVSFGRKFRDLSYISFRER